MKNKKTELIPAQINKDMLAIAIGISYIPIVAMFYFAKIHSQKQKEMGLLNKKI